MTYTWTTPTRYVKGLGPTRAKELTKIGIHTVGDLLEYPPLSYIYPGVTSIADAKEGVVVVKGRIGHICRDYNQNVRAQIGDSTGVCQIVWYNARYVCDQLHAGMTVIFYGKMKGGVLQQPKWTTIESTMENMYGGQYGVHHDTIRAALKEIFRGKSCTELNIELPNMNDGSSRLDCFDEFHFPYDKTMQQIAVYNLKRDEALILQLALAERRRGREQHESVPMWYTPDKSKKTRSYFPYNFTEDQQRALGQTLGDMACAHRPMQRLIHGEVGSGKTAVAFYAAMLAALNDKRTLILCPTTVLAAQHFETLRGMGWDDVALYNGRDEDPVLVKNIVIGTHALLNNELTISLSSLVIIDEFQKFGVEQRARIQKHHPHLLMLSATPIPRSLAATVFGDLDVSVIRELPIKRGTVITKQVLPEHREEMYEIIEKELAKGHQAYVIYPRISGDEDVASANKGWDELHKRWGKHGVVFLTGKNPPDNKAAVMRDFKTGVAKVMVSTIIAEVGLDNPNATVMVVEGADRFGLSQLHQLRGRVCRSTDTVFCFLVSETSNPTSIARLEVIEKCNCGFEIAEHDLRLRGPGEVFSIRQSGLPDLKWCSLVDDYDLMIEAKELVAAGSVGDGVKEMMKIKYGETLGLGGVL